MEYIIYFFFPPQKTNEYGIYSIWNYEYIVNPHKYTLFPENNSQQEIYASFIENQGLFIKNVSKLKIVNRLRNFIGK